MGGAIGGALAEGFGDRGGEVGEEIVGGGRITGTYGCMERVGSVLAVEIPASGGESVTDDKDVEAVSPLAVGGDGEELGLGVTPWSPLRGGVLTGKYTRENAASVEPGRGARVKSYFNERTFGIIDELVRIAGELETNPAAVALAWVQGRPGVDSTIIGARTMEQLESNLSGLAVTLDASQVAVLDAASTPTFGFPLPFLEGAPTIMHAGAQVDGVASDVWPMTPKSDEERY